MSNKEKVPLSLRMAINSKDGFRTIKFKDMGSYITQMVKFKREYFQFIIDSILFL